MGMKEDEMEIDQTIRIMKNFYDWAIVDKEVLEISDDEILALKQAIAYMNELHIIRSISRWNVK